MTPDILQWLGCVFAVFGALLLASKTPRSGYGFILYLISNVFWIAYGLAVNARGLLVMQIFFSITSLIGIYRWFELSFLDSSLSRAKVWGRGVLHRGRPKQGLSRTL
jgi:nicotinamide riboside transporter PnuC